MAMDWFICERTKSKAMYTYLTSFLLICFALVCFDIRAQNPVVPTPEDVLPFDRAVGGNFFMASNFSNTLDRDINSNFTRIQLSPYLILSQNARSAQLIQMTFSMNNSLNKYGSPGNVSLTSGSQVAFEFAYLKRRRVGAIKRFSLHGEYGPLMGFSRDVSRSTRPFDTPIESIVNSVFAGVRGNLLLLFDVNDRLRLNTRYGNLFSTVSVGVEPDGGDTIVGFELHSNFSYGLNIGMEYQF